MRAYQAFIGPPIILFDTVRVTWERVLLFHYFKQQQQKFSRVPMRDFSLNFFSPFILFSYSTKREKKSNQLFLFSIKKERKHINSCFNLFLFSQLVFTLGIWKIFSSLRSRDEWRRTRFSHLSWCLLSFLSKTLI